MHDDIKFLDRGDSVAEASPTPESGFAALSPEHLRSGREAIKREADRIQFQVLADRHDYWQGQYPRITSEALQALLEQDTHYQQLRIEEGND